MIVDAHAHIFQNWIGACGHPTREIHARSIQRGLSHTVAKAFRARDGAAANTEALLDPKDPSWNGLRDVNFRVGRFGRLEFTVDGEDYYIQYMPVGMQDIEAPPELMLAQMAYVGVDHAVLQAGGAYGAMTAYNAFAQLQYPQKFTGLMHVDEALAGSAEAMREIDRGADLGLKGVYYNLDGFARHGFAWRLDDAKLDPFWDKLQSGGLIFCVEITGAPSYDEAGYLENTRALVRVLTRFPGIICHLTMGIPVQFFASDGRWNLPDDIEALYKRDHFYMEVMFPITWGGRWEYPYPQAHPLIKDSYCRFGADKLLWGSDMPNVERFCTYAQSLDYVRRHCDFLSSADMDKILGENAARLYRVTRSSSSARPPPRSTFTAVSE